MSDFKTLGGYKVKDETARNGLLLKQDQLLSSALVVDGVSQTTVEGALRAINNKSGGHIILNESGTSMTERDDLQFTSGLQVSDDSTNGKTIVTPDTSVLTARELFDDSIRRTRRNITNDLANLTTAVSEQNLAKYGYAIGDYFERTDGTRTYTYIIADMNTFKGTHSYCITSNHIGIVVDTHTTSQWHTGSAQNVGYAGSTLHSYLSGDVLNNIKADMIALFGGSTGTEHLYSHQKLFTTALANWGWSADQFISALTCTQVDAGSQWTANGYQEGEASKSLELFRKYKWTEIFGDEYPWLRNISNYDNTASYACFADSRGALNGGTSVTYANFAAGLIAFH